MMCTAGRAIKPSPSARNVTITAKNTTPVTNLRITSSRFRIKSVPSKPFTIRLNQFSPASALAEKGIAAAGAGSPRIPFNSFATPKNSGIPINIGVKPTDKASPTTATVK
ncbi:hypothetical protein D3C75_932410 [compost metagenome]